MFKIFSRYIILWFFILGILQSACQPSPQFFPFTKDIMCKGDFECGKNQKCLDHCCVANITIKTIKEKSLDELVISDIRESVSIKEESPQFIEKQREEVVFDAGTEEKRPETIQKEIIIHVEKRHERILSKHCGDGICEISKNEDCNTCLKDCGCTATEKCENRLCVCAPQCQNKDCGGDQCGGNCGNCHYGSCHQSLCNRGIIEISAVVPREICDDPFVFKKPDTYVIIKTKSGKTFKTNVVTDQAGHITYSWKTKIVDAQDLTQVTIAIYDTINVGSDRLCAEWKNKDISSAKRHDFFKANKKNIAVSINIDK